jgi:hypothetical protein
MIQRFGALQYREKHGRLRATREAALRELQKRLVSLSELDPALNGVVAGMQLAAEDVRQLASAALKKLEDQPRPGFAPTLGFTLLRKPVGSLVATGTLESDKAPTIFADKPIDKVRFADSRPLIVLDRECEEAALSILAPVDAM